MLPNKMVQDQIEKSEQSKTLHVKTHASLNDLTSKVFDFGVTFHGTY